MKTQKLFIGVILNVFCFYFACSAQKRHFTATQWLRFHKEDIDTTPYIFEGMVVKQSTISKTIVVCSVIQITKIYKGSPKIKLGTIKVITEQSRYMEDGDPGLGRGRYIIFGRLTKSKLFDSISTDNSIIVTLMANSIAIFGRSSYDHPAAQWDETKYSTIDSLYSFFRENGLTVQEQIAPTDTTK